jgi:hypothetical protein
MSRIGGGGSLLDGFFDLPAELMTALGTVIGFAVLGDLNSNQQNSLGNFLILIGQILETNANQRFLFESDRQTAQMQAMQRQIDEILRRLGGA